MDGTARRLGSVVLPLFALLCLILLSACGGGGGSDSPGSTGPAPQPPAAGTRIELISDPGDPIGNGRAYRYSQSDAQIGFSSSGGRLGMTIAGNESWAFNVELPLTTLFLAPLRLSGLERFGPHDPLRGGLLWAGEGRSCGQVRGTLEVTDLRFRNGELRSIELRFEQFCDGSGAALRGTIRWSADDSSRPLPPLNPPPGDLWRAPPGAVPAQGNYLYLESSGGDPVGANITVLFTDANGPPIITINGRRLRLEVRGPVRWIGEFDPGVAVAAVVVGFVGNLGGIPLRNPVTGGMNVSADDRACPRATSWFVVDRFLAVDGLVSELDLRFSQQCEGASGLLRGQLRFRAADVPR
jgi:hypothetical protein